MHEGGRKCVQNLSRVTWKVDEKRRCDNIKIDLKEIGCEAMNCIQLAQDRPP
jgi:hypothetical protein